MIKCFLYIEKNLAHVQKYVMLFCSKYQLKHCQAAEYLGAFSSVSIAYHQGQIKINTDSILCIAIVTKDVLGLFLPTLSPFGLKQDVPS